RRQCWNNAAISRWKGSVDKFRYLVVEGPIGAGKTTLAKRLASRLSAELLLEQPSENPFLGRFYQDMARFALPAQLFFLFQRARMIEPLVQPDMFGNPTVADFLLDKDPLFARITLSGDELALYQKIYEALRPWARRYGLRGLWYSFPPWETCARATFPWSGWRAVMAPSSL